MRLRSDVYVSALVRRVFSKGSFAAIEKKGAQEAGAIFIRQRFRDGRETLYAPAPQSIMSDHETDSRFFEVRLDRAEPEEVLAFVEREKRFDPDLWLVELEADDVSGLFPVAANPD